MPSATPPPPAPSPAGPHSADGGDNAALQALARSRERLVDQLHRRIVGQQGVIDLLLTCLFAGGHGLFVGVPGLAKTLLVSSLAQCTGLEFSRVQFTPDLMPSDITGSEVLEEDPASGRRQFRFVAGPVFCNLLLADEINRTPPKTQASLLEAMEERQVSVEGRSRLLPDPFIVIATQNPVEYEGTYPLPEAQLDRFMFKLLVGYPTFEQEAEVLTRHHHGMNPHDIAAAGVRPVASAADLEQARLEVDRVQVEPVIIQYLVALCRATRETPAVQLGVSPRGAASLLHAAKAWAWLSGRPFLTADEVKAVAKPVLRHRLLVRPELELEGTTPDGVLDSLLASVPAPR